MASLYISALLQSISSHRIAVALGLVTLYPLHRRIDARYRAWLAMGPGGVPYNLFGWLLQSLISETIGNPTLTLADPAVFADPALERPYADHVIPARSSFLNSPLPLRPGPTPLVPGMAAPQRQLTQQTSDPVLLADMHQYLYRLAESNKHLGLEIQPARLEGGLTHAIFLPRTSKDPESNSNSHEKLTPSTPGFLAKVHGETCHVHPDGSSHITLSLTDAAEAVTKGWAQRHKLSGASFGFIPPSYVLLYAPRNVEDYVVWKNLIHAGVAFVCGQKIELPEGS